MDKALIKQARIIRNRESAIQSRRKKKEYLQQLEVEVGDLRKENKQLKEENSFLKQKLTTYSNFSCRCANSISSRISVKSSSLMLALLLMIGFNLIPISNYFITTSTIKNVMKPKMASITSRRLLYVDTNVTGEENNSSETEFIPIYFNQTDRVRKINIENVLNWIPQANELLNISNTFDKDYNNFEDPLPFKLSKMYEKSQMSQSRKRRSASVKKKAPKKVVQPPNFNDNFNFHEIFDEIKRKDDTFYVLSFKNDHMLVPASPEENFFKLNLIVPRTNETLSSEKIHLMQIETIVLNTSLIEVDQWINLKNITGTKTKQLNPKGRKYHPSYFFDLDARK